LGSICTIAKKIRKIANLVKMGDTVSVEISKVDISIFSNSNNIKRLADLSDTIIKDGQPKTILGKLSHIWPVISEEMLIVDISIIATAAILEGWQSCWTQF
jgi:hypothetical protein